MNPAISIGAYLLACLITILQTRWCLRAYLKRKNFAKRRLFRNLFLIVYLLLVLLPVEGAMLPSSRLKFALQAAGNIWLGFYVYFGGVLLILWGIVRVNEFMSRRKKLGARVFIAAFSAALSAVLLVYGMIHAQHTIITRYDAVIEKDAGEIKDLKVVLLADLHMSVNSVFSTTQKMVDMVNAEDPDVILIAGDFFTSSYEGIKDPHAYAKALRGLRAKHGVYGVYGNHDVEETLFGGFPISPISKAYRTGKMESFFRDCGFPMLADETVYIDDGEIQIVGRLDGEKAGDGTDIRMSPEEVLAQTDKSKPVIVLQHEPIEFALLKEYGADMVLCGHTHDGQMFPGNLVVPYFNENPYGYRIIGGLDTIVTSGVGYYGPPMRVGTNSEIAVINIHFGASGQ